METKFKAIIFDLDGTLLDTLTDIANSTNAALSQLGFPTHTVDAYRYFIGDSLVAKIKRILPEEHLNPETIEKCLQLNKAEYSKCWDQNTLPFPGIPELLTVLTERKVPMAVLSNKLDHFTQMTVKKLLADWSFDIVLGVSDTIPVKPDPGGALYIAEKLNISPAEFLYLGDTNTDMQTAVAAGMYPVGALWGFRDADELLKNGAKSLAKTPTDVLNFFNNVD